MTTPLQIIEEINKTQQAIIEGNTLLKTIGVKKARAEYEYRKMLSKWILHLRYEKKIPVNLIDNIAKGNEQVAKLRLERDIAQAEYETAKYQLRGLEKSLEAYRSILSYDKTELKSY
ncbi:TPA: hypothetical protein ACOTG0_002063 [Clostridium perfringens]|nr:hypothetical protein phiCPD_00067 [Clostridium phage phiCp-D]